MFNELSIWVVEEGLDYAVQIFSELNIVRGGPNMLHAELLGIRRLLNHTIPWDFCILLSEQDYPLRGNAVLAEYLWVHRGTSFVSVDEGECERDVSYQCGDRVVSLSGGVQYPKIPGMRYASGSQWFAITYQLAAVIGTHLSNSSTIVGTILHDLITVKQPDESFFQAVVLNSEFCSRYSDYTLHWTDKDSMREVRSLTSEYNIMSPGVLIFPRDVAKVSEVRDKSLWAFFARKFDNSLQSTQLKDSLDKLSKQNSRKVWTRVQKHQVPALWRSLARLTQVLASSFADVVSVDRLQRNVDGLFHVQTLQLQLGHGRTTLLLREKLAMPSRSSSLLALRIGCDWNKTDLVFDGDVSAVASSSSGLYSCPSLWAIVHWQMSKKPVSEDLLLVWIDPGGTPMQHAPIKISEHSVLVWHRYTATQPLSPGEWTLEVQSMEQGILARRTFFVYREPSQIPWHKVKEFFDVLPS
ncbi:unnamed protein product [Durusdinium trenchii]